MAIVMAGNVLSFPGLLPMDGWVEPEDWLEDDGMCDDERVEDVDEVSWYGGDELGMIVH